MDAALSSSADKDTLIRNIGLPTTPLLCTNASNGIYATLFFRGNPLDTAMQSVHMVRYIPSVNSTGPIVSLSVRNVPSLCSNALLLLLSEADHTDGTPLNIIKHGSYETVLVPRLAAYGGVPVVRKAK